MTEREPIEERPPALGEELESLIVRANREFEAGLDEAAAFRKLSDRMANDAARRRTRAALAAPALASVGLVVAAMAGVSGSWLARSAPHPDVVAEPPSARSPREATSSPSSRPLATASAAFTAGPERPAGGTGAAVRSGSIARPPARPDPTAAASPASAASNRPARPSAQDDDPDCLQLAREGRPREAERCFERKAAGTGLSAEMALYELARLRRDLLGDAEGAIEALTRYRSRFPRGSLHPEATLSHVELLARVGRHTEALAESDALLTSPAGRERAGEIHLLRGNIYRGALRSCTEAEREYAAAERHGGASAAEATYFRAQCRESVGDVAGARAAYERYLRGQRASRRREVEQRLRELSR